MELTPGQGTLLLVSAGVCAVGAVVAFAWPLIYRAWAWLRRDPKLREAQAAQNELSEELCRAEQERDSFAQEREALRIENDELIAELSDLITPGGGTTAYPLLKREELTDKHIETRTVYIADFAREVAGMYWDDAVIQDRIFEDCYIIGPAVLLPMNTGDMTGHVFVGDDTWWEEGTRAFWALTSDPVHPTGIVGLQDCVFRNCRFKRVGILMSEAELRRVRKKANERNIGLADQVSAENEEESTNPQ